MKHPDTRTTLAVLHSAGDYSITVDIGTYAGDYSVDATEVAQQLREVAQMLESAPEWLDACRIEKENTR